MDMQAEAQAEVTVTAVLNEQSGGIRELIEVTDQLLGQLGLPGSGASASATEKTPQDSVTVKRLIATVRDHTVQMNILRDLLLGALEQVARL